MDQTLGSITTTSSDGCTLDDYKIKWDYQPYPQTWYYYGTPEKDATGKAFSAIRAMIEKDILEIDSFEEFFELVDLLAEEL